MIDYRCIPLAAVLGLTACQPPADWEERLSDEKVESAAQAPEIDEITLEKRDDGLFYAKGADKPFTGTDVEPDKVKAEEEGRMGFVVATPYVDGKVHGDKTTYYPSGPMQEERTYEHGVPKSSVVYFPESSGGGIKVKVNLNAADKAEGLYQRWHPNGQLHTEGHLDADERFHGEFKEYDEDGQLQAHYQWEHQKLVEVIFETPEQKQLRLEKKVFLPSEKPAAPASGEDSP